MVKNVKLKPLAVLIVATGLLVSGGWLYQWWNSPAVSRPVSVAPAANNVLGSDTELTPWQTAYFTTQIPTFLRVRNSTENPYRPQLGQYLLTNTTATKTDQVAVTVGSLGNGSLAEQPAVRLRQNQSATYKADTRSYAPANSFVFSRLDSYETAIIWQRDGQYAAVIVSGTVDRKPDLEATLAALVSDWQWK